MTAPSTILDPKDRLTVGNVPRVSVIMIFLNAERFIAEAIESVLAQTYSDYELILIDDGSTEQCTTIAREYYACHSPTIRLLEHEGHKNSGMSASRNLGISAAKGEFVAFIDADDVWEEDKLAEQVAIMDALPQVGMVCGAARYWASWNGGRDSIVPTGHIANAIVRPPEASLALYPLGQAASPCPSDLLLRRRAVIEIGSFEESFTGFYEDQAFLAKLYVSTPVYFSDRIWLNYRLHPESCCAEVTRDGHYDEVRINFLNWLEDYLAAMPHVDERLRLALRRAFFHHHPVVRAASRQMLELRQISRRVNTRIRKAIASAAGS